MTLKQILKALELNKVGVYRYGVNVSVYITGNEVWVYETCIETVIAYRDNAKNWHIWSGTYGKNIPKLLLSLMYTYTGVKPTYTDYAPKGFIVGYRLYDNLGQRLPIGYTGVPIVYEAITLEYCSGVYLMGKASHLAPYIGKALPNIKTS